MELQDHYQPCEYVMDFELNHIHELEDERDDEKIPFTQLPRNLSDTHRSTKINNTKVIQRYINHNYHWHARDVTTASYVFENSFTDLPDKTHTNELLFFISHRKSYSLDGRQYKFMQCAENRKVS